MTRNLLLVDLETSGTNPLLHAPLSMGLLPLVGDLQHFLVYVRSPHIHWTPTARQYFRHYSTDWEAQAIAPGQACDAIERYLRDTFAGEEVTLVGHNVSFDMAFIAKLAVLGGRERLAGISHRSIDTHTMLYILCLRGLIPESALTSDGAFSHFGIRVPSGARHTALGDAFATRILFLRALSLFRGESELPESDLLHIDIALDRHSEWQGR